KLLKMTGFSERFRLDWVSASEGNRFAQIINEFTEQIRKLGPSPFKNGALLNGLYDEFKAIKSSLSDNRLRALIARQRVITTEGNVYNEIVPKEEFEEILNNAIYDEFIRNKILEKIKTNGKSVPQISKEINLEPHKVLNHIVALRAKGLVDVEKIMEEIPLFISTN
ncbi:MAG: hydrogenase iron-sulfur subunit, partial [Promethearchaeota archaeon]